MLLIHCSLKKKYEEATKFLDSAIEMSTDLGAYSLISNAYKMLYEQDSITESWQNAYQHHKMYIMYRDSIINEDNKEKVMQTQMQ